MRCIPHINEASERQPFIHLPKFFLPEAEVTFGDGRAGVVKELRESD